MGAEKPYLAVILIQTIYAVMILLSKAVLSGGVNSYVFMFYRQLVGTVFLVPLALIFERKNATPLSFVNFCKIFMLAFLGITSALNAFYLGLVHTSATLGAAAINCHPVTTFFFAVLFGLEKVTLRTTHGIAKLAGFTVCMAGVATLALFEGPQLKPSIHYPLFDYHGKQDHKAHLSVGKRWVLGCFFLFISIISWSLWLVLQGTLVTGVSNYLQTWVIEKKGPVFQAVSTPLSLILTIIGSFFLLGEAISFGR